MRARSGVGCGLCFGHLGVVAGMVLHVRIALELRDLVCTWGDILAASNLVGGDLLLMGDVAQDQSCQRCTPGPLVVDEVIAGLVTPATLRSAIAGLLVAAGTVSRSAHQL